MIERALCGWEMAAGRRSLAALSLRLAPSPLNPPQQGPKLEPGVTSLITPCPVSGSSELLLRTQRRLGLYLGQGSKRKLNFDKEIYEPAAVVVKQEAEDGAVVGCVCEGKDGAVRRKRSGGRNPEQMPVMVKEEMREMKIISCNSADEVKPAPVADYHGPFPSYARPCEEECVQVAERLYGLHALPPEFQGKQRERVPDSAVEMKGSCPEDTQGCCGHERSVLDALVGVILSQNTTDANSSRAFRNLKNAFPSWEEVQKADAGAVADAIRCAGLGAKKGERIQAILTTLLEERGEISLEHLWNMADDAVKAELSRFKGVGPKTVSCVLMFHLRRDDFPVDTHVYRISKMLGWVPPGADREKTYLHLNQRIPNHLKEYLHCAFVAHGRSCPNCAAGGRPRKTTIGPCPLRNWSATFLSIKKSATLSVGKDTTDVKLIQGR